MNQGNAVTEMDTLPALQGRATLEQRDQGLMIRHTSGNVGALALLLHPRSRPCWQCDRRGFCWQCKVPGHLLLHAALHWLD